MLKKQFEYLKKSVSETVESGKDSLNSSVDNLSNSIKGTKQNISEGIDSVGNSVKDAKQSVSDSIDNVSNKAKSVRTSFSNTVNDTIDTVQETVDTVTSTVEVITSTVTATIKVVSKVVSGTLSFVGSFGVFFLELGIAVASITAPVPILIGGCMIWLMATLVKGFVDEVDKEKDHKRAARAIKTLKKYGAIPKTAKVKTELINLTIDSEKGEITGQILKGEFKGEQLENLSHEDVQRLIDYSPDEQLKDLLEGYLVFRKNKEKAEVKIIND
jgi:archaellum component FlaC